MAGIRTPQNRCLDHDPTTGRKTNQLKIFFDQFYSGHFKAIRLCQVRQTRKLKNILEHFLHLPFHSILIYRYEFKRLNCRDHVREQGNYLFMMGGTEAVQDHKEAAEILMSESAGRPVGWISSRLDFQSAGYESGRLDVRKGLLCGFDLHQEDLNNTF